MKMLNSKINKSGLWCKEPPTPLHERVKRASSRDSIELVGELKDLYQRSILLQRDDDGYGMEVAGSSPVYVDSIKTDGAAYRVGIQEGDKLLKINGSLVTKWKHQEISSLMEICPFMDLTLLTPTPSKPHHSLVTSRSPYPTFPPSHISHSSSSCDVMKDGQYETQPINAIRRMRKQIKIELQSMKEELDKRPTSDLRTAMHNKISVLSNLQQQLHSMKQVSTQSKQTSKENKRNYTDDDDNYDDDDDDYDDGFIASDNMKQSSKISSPSPTPTSSSLSSSFLLPSWSPPLSTTSSTHQPWSIGGMIRRRTLKVVSPSQVKVATIDEAIFSTIEDPLIFHDLDLLKKHFAHLSVFLHFVMPNFDPSPMLFHIVTEPYEQGSLKEMKKWAYEIYSTFVQQKAPLKVNLEDSMVAGIERRMGEERENYEEMRGLFVEARRHVSKEINYQLSEFRSKRAQGLGYIYGESELKGVMDKAVEARVIENGLWKYFERLSSNQKVNDRCKALTSSLATFFKMAGLSNSRVNAALDRCYTFNAKDKKIKFKTNKKIYNGHQYTPQQYLTPTFCYWCHSMFWGIGPQAFQCTHCGLSMHKRCIEGHREGCSGVKKKKERRTTTSVFDKIISRKSNSHNHNSAIKEAQSQYRLHHPNPGFSTPSILNSPPSLYSNTNDSSQSGSKKKRFKNKMFKRTLSMPSISDLNPFFFLGHKSSLTSLFRSSKDNLKGKLKIKDTETDNKHNQQQLKYQQQQQDYLKQHPHIHLQQDHLKQHPHKQLQQRDTINVCRSESLQGKEDNRTNVRRTHSDVTPENQQTLNDTSGSSSNSSLSNKSSEHSGYASHDDLKTSIHQQPHHQPHHPHHQPHHQPYHLPHHHSHQHSTLPTNSSLHPINAFSNSLHNQHYSPLTQKQSLLQTKTLQQPQLKNIVSSSVNSLLLNPQQNQNPLDTDPDFDVEPDLPSIDSFIPKEILKVLKPKEKKRQEVINELFHTERAHLRNIKVMYHLFHQPMLHDSNPVTKDLAYLLFPNIRELIECHKSINDEFQAKKKAEPLISGMAFILESKLSGSNGARFKRAAATFCQNQSHALEVLKMKMKKDAKLVALLQESGTHPLCRRLELKDLIPTEMQRLSKYPLLIETLLKHTQTNTDEYESLQRCLGLSKDILNHVNHKVEDCENHQRLIELQKRMDRRPIENSMHPVLVEYRRLDLTRHRMIYDGTMTWRICRSKQLEVHAILLEDILVLLQKSPDSDKLVLKCQSSSVYVSSTSPQAGGTVVGTGGGSGSGAKEDKHTHSPIVKLTNLLLRNVATDKRAFFLVSISEAGPQIYEFITPNKDEKNRWFRHISEAADQYKQRKGGGKDASKTLPPIMTRSKTISPPPSHALQKTSKGEAQEKAPSFVSTPVQSPLVSRVSSPVQEPPNAEIVLCQNPSDIHNNKIRNKNNISFDNTESNNNNNGNNNKEERRHDETRDSNNEKDDEEGEEEDDHAYITTVQVGSYHSDDLIQPSEVKVMQFDILDEIPPLHNYAEALERAGRSYSELLQIKRHLISNLNSSLQHSENSPADEGEDEAKGEKNVGTEIYGNRDVLKFLLAMMEQTDHLVSIVNNASNLHNSSAYSTLPSDNTSTLFSPNKITNTNAISTSHSDQHSFEISLNSNLNDDIVNSGNVDENYLDNTNIFHSPIVNTNNKISPARNIPCRKTDVSKNSDSITTLNLNNNTQSNSNNNFEVNSNNNNNFEVNPNNNFEVNPNKNSLPNNNSSFNFHNNNLLISNLNTKFNNNNTSVNSNNKTSLNNNTQFNPNSNTSLNKNNVTQHAYSRDKMLLLPSSNLFNILSKLNHSLMNVMESVLKEEGAKNKSSEENNMKNKDNNNNKNINIDVENISNNKQNNNKNYNDNISNNKQNINYNDSNILDRNENNTKLCLNNNKEINKIDKNENDANIIVNQTLKCNYISNNNNNNNNHNNNNNNNNIVIKKSDSFEIYNNNSNNNQENKINTNISTERSDDGTISLNISLPNTPYDIISVNNDNHYTSNNKNVDTLINKFPNSTPNYISTFPNNNNFFNNNKNTNYSPTNNTNAASNFRPTRSVTKTTNTLLSPVVTPGDIKKFVTEEQIVPTFQTSNVSSTPPFSTLATPPTTPTTSINSSYPLLVAADSTHLISKTLVTTQTIFTTIPMLKTTFRSPTTTKRIATHHVTMLQADVVDGPIIETGPTEKLPTYTPYLRGPINTTTISTKDTHIIIRCIGKINKTNENYDLNSSNTNTFTTTSAATGNTTPNATTIPTYVTNSVTINTSTTTHNKTTPTHTIYNTTKDIYSSLKEDDMIGSTSHKGDLTHNSTTHTAQLTDYTHYNLTKTNNDVTSTTTTTNTTLCNNNNNNILNEPSGVKECLVDYGDKFNREQRNVNTFEKGERVSGNNNNLLQEGACSKENEVDVIEASAPVGVMDLKNKRCGSGFEKGMDNIRDIKKSFVSSGIAGDTYEDDSDVNSGISFVSFRRLERSKSPPLPTPIHQKLFFKANIVNKKGEGDKVTMKSVFDQGDVILDGNCDEDKNEAKYDDTVGESNDSNNLPSITSDIDGEIDKNINDNVDKDIQFDEFIEWDDDADDADDADDFQTSGSSTCL